MIKKVFTLIIIYIFLIGNSYAFLGEGNGLNLYSEIEKGMKDLQLKNFEYEISGGGKGISKEINKILKSKHQKECIKDGLSIKDFESIVGGNTSILIKNIKTIQGCFYKDKIDNKTINNLMGTIVTMDLVYKQKANNKSDDIYKISRIGLYSDGDLNNSQFDLISDIEDIDKIIFTKEIPYNGEKISNSDNTLSNFLKGNIKPKKINNTPLINNLNPKNNQDLSKNNKNLNSNNNNLNSNNNILIPIKPNNNTSYVCSQDNQNSGFNAQTLALITPPEQLSNGSLNNPIIHDIIISGTTNKVNSINNTNNKVTLPLNLSYINKIKGIHPLLTINNSSSSWPCSTFFCIKIELKTYSQNLLGGGNNLSIESYMNTSNGHLKKMSGTFLGQARMAIDTFQLSLKELKLADMFHLGVIITKRSPTIEKDNTRKPGEYKRRLREYYKNNGKNYNRRNDLSIYKDIENEKKTVSNSAELPISMVQQKDKYLKNIQAINSKQNKLVENELDHKILYEDMDIFYNKFIPLESFTKNIINYSENVHTLIKGMNSKPSK